MEGEQGSNPYACINWYILNFQLLMYLSTKINLCKASDIGLDLGLTLGCFKAYNHILENDIPRIRNIIPNQLFGLYLSFLGLFFSLSFSLVWTIVGYSRNVLTLSKQDLSPPVLKSNSHSDQHWVFTARIEQRSTRSTPCHR